MPRYFAVVCEGTGRIDVPRLREYYRVVVPLPLLRLRAAINFRQTILRIVRGPASHSHVDASHDCLSGSAIAGARSDRARCAHNDVKENRALSSQPDSNGSTRKLNILLTEDNPVNRVLAQKLLQKQGHTVTSANNGKEAVQLWEQNQPRQFDIALMDIQMPEMDGLQATAYIREREKQSGTHIPIVAMTAHAMKGDRERCLEGGMDGYISKPITPSGLAKAIEEALSFSVSAEILRVAALKGEKMDEELLARFGGDAELLKELADLFLQSCPKMLEDIRVALQKRDAKALEIAAHSLKGSVGNFFSEGARETAQQLESLGRSGEIAGAEELVHLLEEQVGEFNRVLARNVEGVHQAP
jgi:CheY-like chemotaxis protein/HPt (histidine-containing phosphotransfer) domain-containing protein